MDIEELRKILEELNAFMESSGLSELEVELGGEKIRLKKQRASQPVAEAVQEKPCPQPSPEKLHHITSPMVGTFYRAPSPDSPPYVEVGDSVEPDTVVCIIEAMKVMNEIRAERAGTVVEVLVEDGHSVEYGQPLFSIRPA